MSRLTRWFGVLCLLVLITAVLLVAWSGPSPSYAQEGDEEIEVPEESQNCVVCHKKRTPALYKQWARSDHARAFVGCMSCHGSKEDRPDAWKHQGEWVSSIVTPKDCFTCHREQYQQFTTSHHAKAGEILASLDNVLAEKVAGMPGNNADAVNGCWQCHGSIIKFLRDENGEVLRTGEEQKPVVDPRTWPNSGVGRLNPDGSKGTCNACHSRHTFQAKTARSPENCGKCHMGPDHPQIEIYKESKHGIAFYADRDKMALDNEQWFLGKDYDAAPTCATCHMGSHMKANGGFVLGSHDVGERISWTLRPVVSAKLNSVIYDDGFQEDYPHTRRLPAVGAEVVTKENVVEKEQLVTKDVPRKVAKIVTWEERRAKMKAVCLNCHETSHTDNFYAQFDSLVELYNDKFARPAQQFMNELTADGVLNKAAPFEHKVQWVFWELWHHEGRRARHGAAMMGPDYTHWHGMYEVSKHYYLEFLPAVIEAAATKGPELKEKYEGKVARLLAQDEHTWIKGLSPEEAKALRESYRERYGEGEGKQGE